MVTSEFSLYLLGDLEHLTRQELCLAVDGAVEELVARQEAPGFSLDDRRLADDWPYPLAYQLYGLRQLRRPVTLVTPRPA